MFFDYAQNISCIAEFILRPALLAPQQSGNYPKGRGEGSIK